MVFEAECVQPFAGGLLLFLVHCRLKLLGLITPGFTLPVRGVLTVFIKSVKLNFIVIGILFSLGVSLYRNGKMETQLIPVVLLGCWDFCDDAHCFCCPEQLSTCLEFPSSSNSLCIHFLLANWSSRSTYSLKTSYFCLIDGRLSPFRKSFSFIIENGADLHYLERSQVLFLRESLHLHRRCWQSSCWQCHGDCIQIVAAEHISERWHHLLVLRSRRALEAGLVFSWEPVQRAELLAVISVSISMFL